MSEIKSNNLNCNWFLSDSNQRDLNYLAHQYLAGSDEALRIGNFIGDFVKGDQQSILGENIWKGVLMHRKIDYFTDHHSVVRESKIRLRENYGHYSAVIVDMFYDHLLAANWNKYCDKDLKTYTTQFYQLAHSNSSIMPERAADLLFHMSSTDWLFNYQYIEGLRRSLTGMARRSKYKSGMETAHRALEKDYKLYQSEFFQFFDDLVAYCNDLQNEYRTQG